jgi:hypothetical protein
MLRSTAIIREIDAHHKVDARFSPSVQAHRDRQVKAVLGYLEGRYKPVGKWFSIKYGCAILDDPDHTFLFFKNGDPHPVPCGKWMGWPEKQWHISAAKYKKLSLEERATLECKEQVTRYGTCGGPMEELGRSLELKTSTALAPCPPKGGRCLDIQSW